MMQRLIKLIIIASFLFFMVIPAELFVFGTEAKTSLGGVSQKERGVKLSLKTILDGSFQNWFASKVKKGSGIWEVLLRTDNQLNFTVFRQLSSNYEANVIVGRDNVLIEKAYLKQASAFDNRPLAKLQKVAKQMKRFQLRLAERGVRTLYLISPSKPAIYPEFVPDGFKNPRRTKVQNNYERILPLLKSEDLNLFDAHDYFEKLKSETAYPLFASSGTHWNFYSSCLVSSELTKVASTLLQRKLRTFDCEPVQWRESPVAQDRDLAKMINIWTPEKTYKPSPHPQRRALNSGKEYKPSVLFVGTSFLWAILKFLDEQRFYGKRNMYYYFRRDFEYPGRRKFKIKKADLDWAGQVFNRDLVIIEVNEAFIHRIGYGFLKYGLAAMEGR